MRDLLNVGVPFQVFYFNGGVNMDNSKTVGDISNNRFADNTNIQGDNVRQYKNVKIEEFDKLYSELLDDIKNIDTEKEREQAEYFAEQLKNSVEKNDMSLAKRMVGFLEKILGNASSIVTIASFLTNLS